MDNEWVKNGLRTSFRRTCEDSVLREEKVKSQERHDRSYSVDRINDSDSSWLRDKYEIGVTRPVAAASVETKSRLSRY